MKLWVLSDLHADRGVEDIAVSAPEFDVFICAGDVMTGDIEGSIEMTAAIARGKPSLFVAGNHEWMSSTIEETLELGQAAAARHGAHLLECNTVEIGGIRFAGATLWHAGDPRHFASVVFLQQAAADVVVTHFEPPPALLMEVSAKVWIYGHHHGHFDRMIAGGRLVRNALGYSGELLDGAPARQDFVVVI